MIRDSKTRKALRVLAIAGVALALLLVGLLALTGGLRLRSPIGAMESEIDRFELLDNEKVVERNKIEDAICFLQCSEWTVEIVVARESTQPVDAECSSFAARLELWSGAEVKRITDEYYACLFSIVSPVFGRDAWRATAAINRPESGDESRMVRWENWHLSTLGAGLETLLIWVGSSVFGCGVVRVVRAR